MYICTYYERYERENKDFIFLTSVDYSSLFLSISDFGRKSVKIAELNMRSDCFESVLNFSVFRLLLFDRNDYNLAFEVVLDLD